MHTYDCLALFSGGLDSILAVRLIQSQDRRVLALHFVSPFFGHPDRVEHWRDLHGLDIRPVDVGDEFVRLLLAGPRWGVGKGLNPCVDCKIFMLRRAREMMVDFGARFLITGEVLGQRPMSQRRDTLNIIQRDAGVRDLLVRPLCALRLPATPVEETGLVDRARLLGLSGRGRKGQIALARSLGIQEIPTPAGGCRLTEIESCKRYWPILSRRTNPVAADFALANVGRQLWQGDAWLSMGRNKADNERLEGLARPGDLVFRLADIPGPVSLGRPLAGHPWSREVAAGAAAVTAWFSNKAVRTKRPVRVLVDEGNAVSEITVGPAKPGAMGWCEPDWAEAEAAKRAWFAARGCAIELDAD